MSASYQIQQLLTKGRDGDPDFRFMALADISSKASEPNFSIDDSTESALVEQVLSMFNDSNTEVKNLAAKTISVLVSKVKEDRVQIIIERLTAMTSGKEDSLKDIASLGLKTVVKEISPESRLAGTACNKLAPKIIQQLRNTSASQDLLIQLVEVLADIYARFETTIRASPAAQTEGLQGLTPLLNDSRGAVRKRAIRAIGNLVYCSGEHIFNGLMTSDVLPALQKGETESLKTVIALCGTLALLGKRLPDILPTILQAADSDDEDLREIALQTIETFLLKCPSECTSVMPQITEVGGKSIRYDPNYAANDEDMDEDAAEANGEDEDEDEDEEFDEEEEYDDDDDVSWKVRRASTKVLNMAIETRLDLLAVFWKTVAPILISRFGEREETVRLEVWNSFTNLLRQTGIWAENAGLTSSSTVLSPSSAGASEDGAGSRSASPISSLKRKRDGSEGEESPLSALGAQTPTVTKVIIKQMSTSKSPAVRQAGFSLLTQLVSVLKGGLESNLSSLVPTIESVLKSSDAGGIGSGASGSSTNLKIQIFTFLALVFRTHPVRALQSSLGKLVPLLVNSIGDRSPKTAAQAFVAAAELVKALSPVASSGAPASPSASTNSTTFLRPIFDATVKSLSTNTDQEVREKGIVCLGDLIVHSGHEFGADLTTALQILKERLRNENTALVTLMTISKIAESPSSKSPLFGDFVQTIAGEVVPFLRKSNKPIQAASFVCLEALLHRAGDTLPADTCEAVIRNLAPSIATPDIHLYRSLNCISTVLAAEQESTLSAVQTEILPSVLSLVAAASISLTGPMLDSLLRFFTAYVSAGGDGQALVKELTEIAANTQNGVQVPMVTSRCIGAIHLVLGSTDSAAAAKIVKDAAAKSKSKKTQPSELCSGFLVMGEIGRRTDLSAHQDVFSAALANLTNGSEDVRSAAAFAIGNMAAGNPTLFLPAVLTEIQNASKDDRKLHLLLSSVKEILSHSSSGTLSDLSNALWAPLFQICEQASAQQQAAAAAAAGPKAGDEARLDGTRNIAAECLGKITLTNPSVFLPQLQAQLQAESAGTRAAVITAIRFTFTDSSSMYDDLLAPLIVQFLSLMHDPDLTVRRLAVSSLTSAAHNKPQLVRDHMSALQPLLYQETKIDPALIHEVAMGPFKVRVDDGLNIRKAAYQCMYTLLETCLNKVDLNAYLNIVVGGLSDDDDIKVSCYLMLVKLSNIAPTAVSQRLDAAAQPLDAVLQVKLKETAVKQEVEKLAEMQKSALRTIAALLPLSSESSTPRFNKLVTDIKNSHLWSNEFTKMVDSLAENKTGVAGSDRMDIDV